MKLKKSSIENVEEAKAAAGGAFISARLRNPEAEVAASSRSDRGDLVGGICAIVAALLMAAVTALLYFNWDAIRLA